MAETEDADALGTAVSREVVFPEECGVVRVVIVSLGKPAKPRRRQAAY